MPEPMRVAVLGLTHDHVWGNLPNLLKSENVKVIAAADANEPLRAKFQQSYGGETFTDAHQLLHNTHPDAVLVCASNAESVELVEMAADHGLHCVVEKPMANNLAGADRMLKAADEAGVKLIINWPICWAPSLWHAARLVQEGAYGELWQIRYRSAHNGPENVGCSEYFVDWLYDMDRNGPGAYTDYTCYGAAVCRWLQGVPQSVTGMAGRLVKERETPADNAVLLLQYPKAISIVEASWTQISDLPRKGGMFHCAHAMVEPVSARDLLIATARHPEGDVIPAEPAPKHLQNLGDYLVAIVREEAEPAGPLDPKIARDAQAIMEAGWQAAQTGQAVRPET